MIFLDKNMFMKHIATYSEYIKFKTSIQMVIQIIQFYYNP